jgi:hypothetical protein
MVPVKSHIPRRPKEPRWRGAGTIAARKGLAQNARSIANFGPTRRFGGFAPTRTVRVAKDVPLFKRHWAEWGGLGQGSKRFERTRRSCHLLIGICLHRILYACTRISGIEGVV